MNLGSATNRRVPLIIYQNPPLRQVTLVIIVKLKYCINIIHILTKTNISITIGLILVGLVIFKVATIQTEKPNETNQKSEDLSVESSRSNIPEPESIKPGAYIDFSNEAFVGSAGTKRILFFYSDQIPKSVTLGQEITLLSDQIPENVTILRVNYDSESELKTKYNTTTPNVLIQVDTDGKEISRWNDPNFQDFLKLLK